MFRYLLIIALLLSFPLANVQAVPVGDEATGKKVAFIVGVNKYKKPGFRQLEYAERDVSEMSKELKKIGFEVTMLLGKQATKANLDTTINKLVEPLSADDMILVMLAGHGQQKAGGDAFYCPYDAILTKDESLFSLTKLLEETLAPNVGRKLLLIDACRNDPDPGRGRSVGIQGRKVALPEETVVMFSCRAGQQSFENEKIKHGVFTYCVLDGLRGGASRRGRISWSDLQGHVLEKMSSDEVKKLIPQGRVQTPIPAGGVPFTIIGRVASRDTPPPVTNARPKMLVAPFGPKEIEASRKEWAKYLKREASFTNSIGMKFVLIPPGEFQMGRHLTREEIVKEIGDGTSGVLANTNDTPKHTVRITKPFYISVSETTRKQVKILGVTKEFGYFDTKELTENHPITCDSMKAEIFIKALNKKEASTGVSKSKYRLPTEAEWEFSCRAGSTGKYFWGDNDSVINDYANCQKKNLGIRSLKPVGQLKPNPFGLYDVLGNVFEFCSDHFDKEYYKNSPTLDPKGPAEQSDYGDKSTRGGGYWTCQHCDSTFRDNELGWRDHLGQEGFRLVFEIE